jgi:hypothetical protein
MNDQIFRTVETVDENLDTEDVPYALLEGDFVAAVYANNKVEYWQNNSVK